MNEATDNPTAETHLPKVDPLPTPVIDVSTPDNWVIIVRPASAHWPDKQGKFSAEYWMARATSAGPADQDAGDVVVADIPDPAREADELLRSHRDITEGMVCGEDFDVKSTDGSTFKFADPLFFDSVMDAAAIAIKVARAQGAKIDEPLADYITHLAREADALREGLPVWGDVVFKRDAISAANGIGAQNPNVGFVEHEGKRIVLVSLRYRGEDYEISYEPDPDREQRRQETIIQAIRDLPARVREAEAAARAE